MQEQKNNSGFEYWDFIEKHYPLYYSCDDVLLSDILTRKLNGQEICEEDEEYIEGWNVKEELLKLDTELFRRALENYFSKIFKDK
ncbi:hypothetical protein IVB69_08850 [Flavobacterium sp. J49]|uniref:hypothetical protein n=1 Tax=Flavobacterium sp. J49 TaxID=2718534 RepID=UPI001593615B|nr:hypothetical protein [Flavobacterium sp. J49]MBF6641588.1 hypothetical protein [Flavobacterium sp. J49]NIC02835.1 hypothetical protein [Flavobacterium sp. J49]